MATEPMATTPFCSRALAWQTWGKAIAADSFILMKANATKSYADGKVKVELGDDPERKGTYTFSFSLYNLTAAEKTYDLSADFFTQDVFTDSVNLDQDQGDYMDTRTTPLDMTVTFDTGSRVTVPPTRLPHCCRPRPPEGQRKNHTQRGSTLRRLCGRLRVCQRCNHPGRRRGYGAFDPGAGLLRRLDRIFHV